MPGTVGGSVAELSAEVGPPGPQCPIGPRDVEIVSARRDGGDPGDTGNLGRRGDTAARIGCGGGTIAQFTEAIAPPCPHRAIAGAGGAELSTADDCRRPAHAQNWGWLRLAETAGGRDGTRAELAEVALPLGPDSAILTNRQTMVLADSDGRHSGQV